MGVIKELTRGKIADARFYEAIAGAAEGEIDFGQFAVLGTDPEEQFEAFDGSSGEVLAGIAMFGNSGNIDDLKYEDEDLMKVVRKGVVWAPISDEATEAVEAGDGVGVNEDGFAMKASEIESKTDGTDNGLVIKNAEFASGGEAEDVVKIELNLPGEVNEEDLSE